MSNDLFGFTSPDSMSQGELSGPSFHVGRKCIGCGSPIVTTESGFESCERGCGKLKIPVGYSQAEMKNVTIPVWTRRTQ